MPSFSKFITSQRGHQQLLDSDGHVYSRKKGRDTALSQAWRCFKYNPPQKCPCHCYLAIADNSLSLGGKPHTHSPPKAEPQRREVVNTLKRKASEQQLSVTQNLISEVLATTTPATNRVLPNMRSMARVVQRSRADSSGFSTHPEAKTSTGFVLPPTCYDTRREEPFVLYDGHTDRNVRVVAFATSRNLMILAKYVNWICDGTYYIAPKIFAQSYTIHAVINNKCVPLVYILTGDQKGDTYAHVLSVITYYFDQNCPVGSGTVLIDFEKAVMNAFRDVLPSWAVSNCFFHLCPSVQKKIQKSFKIKYFTDKLFARAARLVVFLAFVPLTSIEDAFEDISYYMALNYPQLMGIVSYFENTYLGANVPESLERITPQFPVKFWNHFDTILADCDFPRTSNMVEGFHRGFKTRVNRPKPTVQEYFRAIRDEQSVTDYHIDRLEVGITPSKRRRTSNENLFKICDSYATYANNLDYMFAIAEYFGHKIE